jgi:hypothetical protein
MLLDASLRLAIGAEMSELWRGDRGSSRRHVLERGIAIPPVFLMLPGSACSL